MRLSGKRPSSDFPEQGSRGAERPVDVRLARTVAERRPHPHCPGAGVLRASGTRLAPTGAGAETNDPARVEGKAPPS